MSDQKISQLIDQNPEEDSFNLYAIIFKYLVYWPWFVASVLVCLIGTFIYLRYQTPVYNITSSVLIKEQDNKSGGGSNPLAAIQDLGMMSFTNSFDNEVEILKSKTLVKKVVSDLGLYINHSEARTFGYNLPLYKNTPVQVYMTPEEADKLPSGVRLKMDYDGTNTLNVLIEYTDLNQEDKEIEASFTELPTALPTEIGVFTFTPDTTVTVNGPVTLMASVISPLACAQNYCTDMTIAPTSKTTTIAKIDVKNTLKERGVDFINHLVEVYNQDANDEKNEVAQKTAEFIEERIAIINDELGSAESELASFKQRSGLTDLTSDAQIALQENSRYEQQLTQNATQINLVQDLQSYINNPKNANEVIPANVGLEDQSLNTIINQYNTLIVERKRLLRTSSENNPAVINMNSGIEAMRSNVQTTVTSVLRGLRITQKNLEREANKFVGRISDAPKHEKEFMTIQRQQEIKATLYIMLLQKREENALTLAATASNGRIIEDPLPGKSPVAPRKMIFMLAALILGVAIPVGIIYLIDLLKYKIENREDVEKLTTVPVIGELPIDSNAKKGTGAIVVRENKNNIMEETFRGLRTNLLFMLEKDQKVILFSSTQPGEGKSFVAANLATSLAYLGKKVVVVGMDIRKPGLNKVFGFSLHAKGITNYLSDPEHVNLFDMVQKSTISPNLDILPGGPVPPNPTELVARPVLEKAIDLLKERYDYILLDTAPIAMVTDTAIIGRVADMCVYVCRADATPKAAFQYINVLQQNQAFPKLATVINGIDLSQRKNSYSYGYGRKYGYGYGKQYGHGYGYGYGYGYGFEAENKTQEKK